MAEAGEVHPRSWTEKDVRQFLQSAASGAARLHAEAVTKARAYEIFYGCIYTQLYPVAILSADVLQPFPGAGLREPTGH